MEYVRIEVCPVRPGNCARLRVHLDLGEEIIVLCQPFKGRAPQEGSKIDYALGAVGEPKPYDPVMQNFDVGDVDY